MPWIPCNLPWSSLPIQLDPPPSPSIPKERYQAVFGTDPESLRSALFFNPEDFLQAQKLLLQMHQWEAEQPEWLAYHEEAKKMLDLQAELEKQAQRRTFCGQRLNFPGVVVELEDGRRIVLGHTDQEGRVGSNPEVSPEQIVVRYMVLDLPGLEVLSDDHITELQFQALNDAHESAPADESGRAACFRLGFRTDSAHPRAAEVAAAALEVYLAAYRRAPLTLGTSNPK